MAEHDHTLHHGESLTEAARMALMRSGEQWTAMRADIYESLKGFQKPASAYDIADAVSKSRGKRVAANSVYRILDVFVGANIATRVESANAYIVNAHPDCEHDCIFLVCTKCGQTTHIDDDHLSDGVRASALKAGFKPVQPVIEVKGICADCG